MSFDYSIFIKKVTYGITKQIINISSAEKNLKITATILNDK